MGQRHGATAWVGQRAAVGVLNEGVRPPGSKDSRARCRSAGSAAAGCSWSARGWTCRRMKSLQKRAGLEQESLPCLGVLLSFNMWWAAGAERKVRLCQGGGRARAEEHERRRQAQQQRRRWHSQHSQNARSARSSSCRGDKAGRIHPSGGRSPRRQSACKPVRLGTPRNADPATTRTRPDAQTVRNSQTRFVGWG